MWLLIKAPFSWITQFFSSEQLNCPRGARRRLKGAEDTGQEGAAVKRPHQLARQIPQCHQALEQLIAAWSNTFPLHRLDTKLKCMFKLRDTPLETTCSMRVSWHRLINAFSGFQALQESRSLVRTRVRDSSGDVFESVFLQVQYLSLTLALPNWTPWKDHSEKTQQLLQSSWGNTSFLNVTSKTKLILKDFL